MVSLNAGERQRMETEINRLPMSSPKRTALAALLLADHSQAGQKLSDAEVAKRLNITHAKTFYIRHCFTNSNFRLKTNLVKRRKWKSLVNYRLARLVSHRLWLALKSQGLKKTVRTSQLLGCSIESFKVYMAQMFERGMSWENYGARGWHLDHVRPCASFDLRNSNELKQCFHFTNYQPLWSAKNVRKSSLWKGKFWRHTKHER